MCLVDVYTGVTYVASTWPCRAAGAKLVFVAICRFVKTDVEKIALERGLY